MNAIFLTHVSSPNDFSAVRLLIHSLQSFGGELSASQVWVFASDPQSALRLESSQVQIIPLSTPTTLLGCPFAQKVSACAQAEALAPAGTDALIWLDPECLILQPPLLYALGAGYDAALRPVHLRNIGLPLDEPPDAFWAGIYQAVGAPQPGLLVESFIDRQVLRAYFNTHIFSLRPGLGLCRRWSMLFERLVSDRDFQAHVCSGSLHQIFLFQALLSVLIAASIPAERIRILPPGCNYPYNLHGRVPPERRAKSLTELVSLTYEGRSLRPDCVTDIEIPDPLRGWLTGQTRPVFG